MKHHVCIYCKNTFESGRQLAAHIKWCEYGPYRTESLKNLTKGRHKITTESRKVVGRKVSELHKNGHYEEAYVKAARKNTGRKHSNETKAKISISARNSNHRRLVRGTRIYIKRDGTEVLLDSSWEESLANRLDIMEIEWDRPDPIIYTDKEGKDRNYFPDFYLPKYDLYLDPKNEYAYRSQIEKIKILFEIMPNLIILHSLQEIEEFDPEMYDLQTMRKLMDVKPILRKGRIRKPTVSDEEIILTMRECRTQKELISRLREYGTFSMDRAKELAKENEIWHFAPETDRVSHLISQIKSADIDTRKLGWVAKVSKIIGITDQKTRKWLHRNFPEFLEGAYTRKPRNG